MEHLKIEGIDSVVFNATARDYLKNSESVAELLDPRKPEEILKSLQAKFPQLGIERKTLSEALQRQYGKLKGHSDFPLVQDNLQAITDEKTFFICTGQQIHPFLGPLFVFYKIWSCIDQAKLWSQQHPGYRFIPIFWMASEDHDFDEIKDVKLYNDIFSWERTASGPVGRLSTEGLTELLSQLENRADATPGHKEFFEICRQAYSSYDLFADATRHLVHEIFGSHGLLSIDPDDASLKAIFRPHMQADILRSEMQDALRKNIDKMKSAGIGAPIGARPINHFYLGNSNRERIIRHGDLFETGSGTEFKTEEKLGELIESHPEDFSPNALLRPLYQQSILPCAAYVCGGAELIYWLELGAMFEERSVQMPKLVLRNSSFIIGSGILSKVKRENIEVVDLFLEDDLFLDRFAQRQKEELSSIQQSLTKLYTEIDFLQNQLHLLPDSRSFAKAFHSFEKQMSSFGEKAREALQERAKNSTEVQTALKLRTKITGNPLQERSDHCVRFIDILLRLNKDVNRPLYWDPTDIHIFITS